MAEIVNLNKRRKAQKRTQDERGAKANRIKFGRSKAQKENDRLAQDRAQKNLDDKSLS